MSDQKENNQEVDQETPFKKPQAKKATKKVAKKRGRKKKEDIDVTKLDVVVINADGSDSDQTFEVQKVTSSALILKEVKPDFRNVIINGETVEVDYNLLKRLPEDSTHLGKPVSAIITAIELS